MILPVTSIKSAFTGDQLQFIGLLVVTFGSMFIGLVWRVAVWKTKLENDVDNLGYILGTEKGMARHDMKEYQKKTGFFRNKK